MVWEQPRSSAVSGAGFGVLGLVNVLLGMVIRAPGSWESSIDVNNPLSHLSLSSPVFPHSFISRGGRRQQRPGAGLPPLAFPSSVVGNPHNFSQIQGFQSGISLLKDQLRRNWLSPAWPLSPAWFQSPKVTQELWTWVVPDPLERPGDANVPSHPVTPRSPLLENRFPKGTGGTRPG